MGGEKNILDLVFLMDCTGSMGSYINAAKQSIQAIISRIIQQANADVRLGLIAYRDHPPQDMTYVTKIFEFTRDIAIMQSNLDTLSAAGGGDGPEAVTAALFAAENLPFREEATKICILIADAPPHGIGESGDGFPNGDPDGHDPLSLARSMAKKGIVIYSVGCEPALGEYRNARAFMVSLAEITEGQAIALSSSSLLAEVILGGSIEELGLKKISDQYEHEMAKIAEEYRSTGRDMDDEKNISEITKRLQKRIQIDNVQNATMKCDGKMSDVNSTYFTKNSSLASARAELDSVSPALSAPVCPFDPPVLPGKEGRLLATFGKDSSTKKKKSSGIWGFFGKSKKSDSSSPVRLSTGSTGDDCDTDAISSDGPEFCSPSARAPPSSYASHCDVVTEDVSEEQCRRMFSRAHKAGKF